MSLNVLKNGYKDNRRCLDIAIFVFSCTTFSNEPLNWMAISDMGLFIERVDFGLMVFRNRIPAFIGFPV